MNPNVNLSRGSTPGPSSIPPSPPLQRGKACLSCRRRKMKCDGARPVCTPCLRGERTEDCEYTDGQHRPRTLALEEDVARLRARVWELENPTEVMPSVELHPPYADAGMGGSAGPSLRQVQQQGQPPSFLPHHQGVGVHPHGLRSGGSAEQAFPGGVQVDVQHALSTIAPYAAELGLFLNPDRLRVQGTHILPALQNAFALWSACIIPPSDPTLVSKFLSQTQTELASALSTVDAELDPVVFLHIIQTGALLAYYMQRIGQIVGARYYASGTWTLVVLSKLYQDPYLPPGASQGEGHDSRAGGVRGRSSDVDATAYPIALGGFARLPQALDGIEAEERVRAFWAVYALDRWLSVASQGQCQSLPSSRSAGSTVTVPWPGVSGENEASIDVIQRLLNDRNHSFTRDDPTTMHAKASVLLGEALEIAALFVADRSICQSPGFQARFGTLDALLQRCLNTTMTMAVASHGHRSQAPGPNQALLTVHLVALAHVTLHRPFVSAYGPSRRRCLDGAMGTVRVLDRIGELRAQGGLSPIYAIVWTALCLSLHEEVLRLRARPDADPARRREEGEIIAAIRKLVGILSAMSQHCPSKFFAAKIEAVLPVLESISVS